MDQSRRSILRASGVALAGLVAGCGQETAASELTPDDESTPGGTTMMAEGDPSEDETPNTERTTEAADPTATPEPRLYDDFEGGDLADAYVGDREQYVLTDGIDGDYALRVEDDRAPLSLENARTPRGCEYRTTVRPVGGPNVRVNVQDPATPRDPGCYSVQIVPAEDLVRLYAVIEDTDVLLDSIEAEIDAEQVVVSRLQIGAETVRAIVEDADGTELGRTDAVAETTFEGGTVGFHTYGTPGTVWDEVRRVPL